MDLSISLLLFSFQRNPEEFNLIMFNTWTFMNSNTEYLQHEDDKSLMVSHKSSKWGEIKGGPDIEP